MKIKIEYNRELNIFSCSYHDFKGVREKTKYKFYNETKNQLWDLNWNLKALNIDKLKEYLLAYNDKKLGEELWLNISKTNDKDLQRFIRNVTADALEDFIRTRNWNPNKKVVKINREGEVVRALTNKEKKLHKALLSISALEQQIIFTDCALIVTENETKLQPHYELNDCLKQMKAILETQKIRFIKDFYHNKSQKYIEETINEWGIYNWNRIRPWGGMDFNKEKKENYND